MRVRNDPVEGLVEVLAAYDSESELCDICGANFAERLESVRDEEVPVCEHCLETRLTPVNNGDTYVYIDEGCDDYDDDYEGSHQQQQDLKYDETRDKWKGRFDE